MGVILCNLVQKKISPGVQSVDIIYYEATYLVLLKSQYNYSLISERVLYSLHFKGSSWCTCSTSTSRNTEDTDAVQLVTIARINLPFISGYKY